MPESNKFELLTNVIDEKIKQHQAVGRIAKILIEAAQKEGLSFNDAKTALYAASSFMEDVSRAEAPTKS